MNKKAQAGLSMLGISIMISIFLFMIGITQINFIKDIVTSTRGASQLNCAVDTISDGNKLTCLLVDLVIPYFIITVISAAGGLITARILT